MVEIGKRLGTVQNTTSAHLKVLSQVGLIRAERKGRAVRSAADMIAFLVEDRCVDDAVAEEYGADGCGCSEKCAATVAVTACCRSAA